MSLFHLFLNVDSAGNVLSVVNSTTGKSYTYEAKLLSEAEILDQRTAKKLVYHTATNVPLESMLSPRAFGDALEGLSKVTVFSDRLGYRYPSACLYELPAAKAPRAHGLPMNFDYAELYYMREIEVDGLENSDNTELLSRLVEARKQCYDNGYGHPGLTNVASLLKTLADEACHTIAEDVLAHPYHAPSEATPWRHTLREDGFVGLYRLRDAPKRLFVLVHNALPFWFCDQIRVVIEKNPDQWNWLQWTQSDELANARKLSEVTAEEIAKRVVESIKGKFLLGKVVTMFNVVNSNTESGVSYGAGVQSTRSWSNGCLIRQGEGRQHFTWILGQTNATESPKWLPVWMEDTKQKNSDVELYKNERTFYILDNIE
jgi:hypothetical protein